MRVLAVGNMYPPHHLGGYELVWRSAIRHLRSEGGQARVLTTDYHGVEGGVEDPETFRELRWYWRDHAWPRVGWRARIALERHNAAVLDRHVRDFEPDVVSWWAMGGMSLSLIESVRRAGLPSVAFVHDDWLRYASRYDRWTAAFRRRPALAALAERAVGVPAAVDLDAALRYVFVSETVKARAQDAGFALRGGTVAHSGIDPAFLDPRPEQPWGWRLLYVGRIDERKGVTDAVASLAELPDRAVLTIVGGGSADELTSLRSCAGALGVTDRVRILGMRQPTELREHYEAADAVLFPVRWEEPWGLVPLEAMGMGRPVVATGRGGSGEFLRDGENCVLAEAGDPGALAHAVRRLAADRTLRSRLRAGGQQTAEQHTEPAFNEQVARALRRAAATES